MLFRSYPKGYVESIGDVVMKELHDSLVNLESSQVRVPDFGTFKIKDREFMKTYFSDILDLYDALPLQVMRTDLWRYCIIYIYGGIYADTDTILYKTPEIFTHPNKQLVVVPENNVHFCQWVFAAPPGSSIIKSIINLSVERMKKINLLECKEIGRAHV